MHCPLSISVNINCFQTNASTRQFVITRQFLTTQLGTCQVGRLRATGPAKTTRLQTFCGHILLALKRMRAAKLSVVLGSSCKLHEHYVILYLQVIQYTVLV